MSQPKQCYNSQDTFTQNVTVTLEEIIFYMRNGRIMQSKVDGFLGDTVFYGNALKSTFVHKLDKTIEQLFEEQPNLVLAINQL